MNLTVNVQTGEQTQTPETDEQRNQREQNRLDFAIREQMRADRLQQRLQDIETLKTANPGQIGPILARLLSDQTG